MPLMAAAMFEWLGELGTAIPALRAAFSSSPCENRRVLAYLMPLGSVIPMPSTGFAALPEPEALLVLAGCMTFERVS